jgi:sterol desaturase/sphingolipid hydroxylase (fatty acid hydroxylase superfamily)
MPDRFVFGAIVFGLLIVTVVAEQKAPVWLEERGGDGRLVVNVMLGCIGFAIEGLTPLSAAAMSIIAGYQQWGLLNHLKIPTAVSFALSLLIVSLASYLLHRASHSWVWLWRIHRVHHTDMSLDVTSAFRHHPLERLVALGWITAAAIGLGLSPAAIILYGALALLVAIPQHANLALGSQAEKSLGRFLITPGLHHVHHSADQPQTDSNYGDVFTIWDQLFGTWQTATLEERRDIRIGLGDRHDCLANKLHAQLLSPFRRVHDARGATRMP